MATERIAQMFKSKLAKLLQLRDLKIVICTILNYSNKFIPAIGSISNILISKSICYRSHLI
jgi:hypothetical protein